MRRSNWRGSADGDREGHCRAHQRRWQLGKSHHHIGLNTWAGTGASPPPSAHTGLYHFAILSPNRHELAKVLKRLLDAHYPLQGTSDHGVAEAIYVADPDGNGVELSVDRPPET
jgi:catechol 2,3-dioxygenase